MQTYVSLVDLTKSFLTILTCKNRLRYGRERASQASEVIQFILPIHSLLMQREPYPAQSSSRSVPIRAPARYYDLRQYPEIDTGYDGSRVPRPAAPGCRAPPQCTSIHILLEVSNKGLGFWHFFADMHSSSPKFQS